MDSLLLLIVYLLVAAVLIYVVNLVVGMLTLPAQVKTIILIIVSLIFLIAILRMLGIIVL
jgi:hypothetical protein